MRSKGRELTSCPAPAERWRATAGLRAEAEETAGADVWLGSFWKKKPFEWRWRRAPHGLRLSPFSIGLLTLSALVVL